MVISCTAWRVTASWEATNTGSRPARNINASIRSGSSSSENSARGSLGKAPGSHTSKRRKAQSTTYWGAGTFLAGSAALRQ